VTWIKRLVFVGTLLVTGCSQDNANSKSHTNDIDRLCQFDNGPCRDADSALSLFPVHAPSEQWLKLTLYVPENLKIIAAKMEGRDMFMGVIPVTFDDSGRASIIYGSCSSGYMVWRLMVEFEDEKGKTFTRQFDWLADNPDIR
jgi:hypothetical protein